MSKHTPGPWRVEDPLGPYILSIVSNPDGEVYDWGHVAQVSVRAEESDIPTAEARANALLIAAAPRLRAALAALVDVCHEAPPAVLAEACAALADADGLSEIRMPTTGHNYIGSGFDEENKRLNDEARERLKGRNP
jgi:hypothetical protein